MQRSGSGRSSRRCSEPLAVGAGAYVPVPAIWAVVYQ